MQQWINDDQHDDMQAFADEGEFELVAVRLAGSGAIEENNNECERNINAVARSITYRAERIRINRCLKGYRVYVCQACNGHVFISKHGDWDESYRCPSCGKANEYRLELWDDMGKRRGAK